MSLREDVFDIRDKLESGRYVNEAAVSQGVVRRLLDSLRWPVYDTDILAPEYSLGGRRVDYALCHRPGKPRVLVEVKQVGHGVGAERQLFEYAFHRGIQMAVLTDGREWHFYLPAGEGDYSERRVHKLDLVDDNLDAIEERFVRYLDYDAVHSGDAITAAQKDYRDLAEKRQIRTTLPEAWIKLVETEDDLLVELLAEKVRDLCGVKPDPDTTAAFLHEQVQLRSKSSAGTQLTGTDRRSRRPSQLKKTVDGSGDALGYVLNGKVRQARNGSDLMVKLFNELADQNDRFLQAFADLPKSGRQKRPYIATSREALYPGSPQLVDNAHRLRSKWWLDTHMGNPQKVKIIKKACEVAGIRYGADIVVRGLDP